jgi:hypothetical protein
MLRRWCLATRDAHGFYVKFGDRPVSENRWMGNQGPKERWQDPVRVERISTAWRRRGSTISVAAATRAHLPTHPAHFVLSCRP